MRRRQIFKVANLVEMVGVALKVKQKIGALPSTVPPATVAPVVPSVPVAPSQVLLTDTEMRTL